MAMTNTERIEANNAELRELIETAEALPDAGEATMDDLFLRVTLNEDGTYTPSYTEVVNAYQANGELPYIILEDYTIPLVACALDFQDHVEYPTMVFVRVVDETTGELATYRLKYDNTWTMETVGDGGGIEFLPITLNYGNDTYEPEYIVIGTALQNVMNGNGNKVPVIVNNIMGNQCMFCGVDIDGFPMFCDIAPMTDETTNESALVRYGYVLRPDNTFLYTTTIDGREFLNASNLAKSNQVLNGYNYLKQDGTVATGTYEPPAPTLQSKTVTPSTSAQTVKPDAGYDGLSQVTVNAMPTATQATPSISVSSAGLITASATQSAGYVSAGTKSATKQLTTQAAKTITPTTSNQTAVASGVYTLGVVTVKGDANLKAENIKSGVSIFGVAGSHSGAEDLSAELTEYESLNAELESVIDSLPSAGGSGGDVATCTVILNISNASLFGYSFTVCTNGKIGSENISYTAASSLSDTRIQIDNVACGSSVFVAATGWNGSLTFSVNGDASFDDYLDLLNTKSGGFFTIGDSANSTITIDVYDDD